MVFVIAEIGVNWDGDFDIAKDMMKKAKEFGCNAVKFQAFKHQMVKEHPERERLEKSAISESNIKQIDNIAKTVGIEWFCTPMYPEAVDFLEPYVERFKIRFSDGLDIVENKDSPILNAILTTKKKIIISSQKNPTASKYYDDKRVSWLYCVPNYPTSLEDLNFTNAQMFDGYSNHCPEIIAPLTASILGMEIIEVHVTLDKKSDFIDNVVSLDYEQLRQLVKLIRYAEKIRK